MSSKKTKEMYIPRFGSQSSSRNLSRKPQVDSERKSTNINANVKQISKVKSIYQEVQISPRKSAVIAKTQVTLSPILSSSSGSVKKTNRMALKKLNRPNKSSCEKDALPHSYTVSKGTPDDGEGSIFNFIDKDDPLFTNKTSKTRESVLRTIARMLLENRQIRRRLVILSQQSQAGTGIN